MENQFKTKIQRPEKEVFSWLLKKESFDRLLPPWAHLKILSREGKIKEKELIVLKTLVGKWALERTLLQNGIKEKQMKGLLKRWDHLTRINSQGESASEIEDLLDFDSPWFMSNKRLLKKLAKIFSWRHAITSYDLSLYDRYPSKPKKILLSGSSGLIGSSMLAFLRAGGHEVIRLVREKPSPDAIVWDPRYEKTNKQAFEGFDAVLHLAGENIAERWTEKKKNSIFLSRARDTWLLSEILSRLQNPPKVLICASAIGFYGDRKEELLTEDSRKGEGFLSDVCAKWEAATLVLENRGIRVVQTRFGAVLSPAGGILKKMLPAFQMNLGGKLGSGKQFISWIAIDDLIGALYHILMKEDLKGVFNCTSPHPVMQKDFAKTLAKVLHRKAFISMPAFLLRSIFGEMADEMLLASQNVIPKKLVESGYTFSFPELEKALRFWY